MFREAYAIIPLRHQNLFATDTKRCKSNGKTQQLLLIAETKLNKFNILLTTSEQLLAELDYFLIET